MTANVPQNTVIERASYSGVFRFFVVPLALICGGFALLFGVVGAALPRFVERSVQSPFERNPASEYREFDVLRQSPRNAAPNDDERRAGALMRFHERAIERIDWSQAFRSAAWRPFRIASFLRIAASLWMIVGAILVLCGGLWGVRSLRCAAILLVAAAACEAIAIDRTLYDWCAGIVRDVKATRHELRTELELPESSDFDSAIGLFASRGPQSIRQVILAFVETLKPGPAWRRAARVIFGVAIALPILVAILADLFGRPLVVRHQADPPPGFQPRIER